MHEYGIAKSVIETLLPEAEKNGRGRIIKIELVLGDFNNVMPESLLLHLEALSRGTAAQDAEVKINRVALEVKCHECGKTGRPADKLVMLCPHCGGLGVEIVAGKELEITAIEVE